MASTTDITHIVATPGVRGGKPRIRGHRIAVHDIALRTREGMRPEEMAEMYRLTLGEVHAALSYYYDHRDQIDREITEEDEEIRRLGQEDTSPVAERLREARRERGGEALTTEVSLGLEGSGWEGDLGTLRRTAHEFGGSLADKDVPGWEMSEAARRWVRSLRHESDEG